MRRIWRESGGGECVGSGRIEMVKLGKMGGWDHGVARHLGIWRKRGGELVGGDSKYPCNDQI